MNYLLRLAKSRPNYFTALRELTWRSFARAKGWLDYDEYGLPWHWGITRFIYHTYYRFKHRKDVIPSLPRIRTSTLRYADEHGKGMWSYSRELSPDEPPSHARTIDLFALEQKWGKKIILVGWIGKRVSPASWPEHLEWDDYVVASEDGKLNSHADELPGWENS